jgi:hypothetical protein
MHDDDVTAKMLRQKLDAAIAAKFGKADGSRLLEVLRRRDLSTDYVIARGSDEDLFKIPYSRRHQRRDPARRSAGS